MSADNGIYILKTRGPEYRVAHLQAVENYNTRAYYDGDIYRIEHVTDPDYQMEQSRAMWEDSPVFHNEDEAMDYAFQLQDEHVWTEYGICYIVIDRVF